MEALGLYLLKSAVWLTGFTLVFLMVLRNERYFRLNRIYLLSGIVASIAFPFYTWHYAVVLPAVQVAFTTTSGVSAVAMAPVSTPIPIYWWLYLVGMVSIAIRLVWQTVMVVRKLRKTGYVKTGSVKLVRTAEYAASFSFFSYVFVNPSIADIETKEIVNHEREHIQQKHWFDLLLVELLCMLQWFNPFIWIYARLIRQNHEYLADEMALQHTSNPAIYQATLLNQMLGAPVISLANSFSYSLNKKRFKMMKKKIDSPFRKLRMLLVLPLVAMVFYAFAKPEYITPTNAFPTDNVTANADGNDVKGKVVKADGKPLHGTSVILTGTTIGTIADEDGNFKLKDVPKDGVLVFSFVGYQTVEVKPDFGNPMIVKMVPATFGLDKVVVVGFVNPSGPPPPPPPPPLEFDWKNPPLILLDDVIIDKAKMDAINPKDIESINVLKNKSGTDLYGEKGKNGVILINLKKNGVQVRLADGSKTEPAMYFVDGKEKTSAEVKSIDPNRIESMNVLKGEYAVKKYGEKGREGVIEIKLKSATDATAGTSKGLSDVKVVGYGDSPKQQNEKEVFVVVEEMPEFPGGIDASRQFIVKNIKYPVEAQKANAQGTVILNFVVNSNGKVENAKVVRALNPALDAEALRVIKSMPDWKPGKQRGTAVDVVYTMPIEFKLQ